LRVQSFDPGQRLRPWIAMGVAFDRLLVGFDSEQSSGGQASFSGVQLRVEAGLDLLLGAGVQFGPFVEAGVCKFLEDQSHEVILSQTALASIQGGVRLTVLR
jgi:hypothetical protein